MPYEVMRVRPVPKGSIFLEEGGSEGNSAQDEDGEELAVLLHLEYPGFEGFSFLLCEGRGTVRLQVDNVLGARVRGCLGCCGREGIEALLHASELVLEVMD